MVFPVIVGAEVPFKVIVVPAQVSESTQLASATGIRLEGLIVNVFAKTWSPLSLPLLLAAKTQAKTFTGPTLVDGAFHVNDHSVALVLVDEVPEEV